MRGLAGLCGLLAVASALWAIVAAYRMGGWLTHHGVKVNWFWYRVTMPWYVQRYKTMTTERDGRPGPLFPQFLVAIGTALVLGIVVLIALVLGKG